MENYVFRKVYLEDNTPIRIYLTILENSVRLIVIRNESAWKSFVISDVLNGYAMQHKFNLEGYIEKLVLYIKEDCPNITFNLTEENFFINRLLNNSLKVKFFTCKLEKVNYVEYVEDIMDTFYSENVKYMNKIKTIVEEKNEIETYKISCELKLKELIEKKKTDEDDLFGRFVLILNEKKQRIQHLMELLEAFKAGRPTVNPQVIAKSRKKKASLEPTKKLETISESESSESSHSNTNTDDEGNSNTTEDYTNNDICEPSTSTACFKILELDETDETPSLPKRCKTIGKHLESAVVVPSTSKTSEDVYSEPVKKSKEKDAPVIDFSTQQLLDML